MARMRWVSVILFSVAACGSLAACGRGGVHGLGPAPTPVVPPGPEVWTPGPGLKTRWASEVDLIQPRPEYPRPQMVRPDWLNLNGLWDLSVLPREADQPEAYPDRILVPFPVESSLSGVARRVGPDDRIWYRRTFSLPDGGDGTRWLLHFGAVDWEAEVFLNGARLGTHRGGYDPFSFDITEGIRGETDQELVVAVWDPTDEGSQPRGKQVLNPRGIWYTAVSGIWQTVWLEPVPEVYIAGLRVTPKPDQEAMEIEVDVKGSPYLVPVQVSVLADGERVATKQGLSKKPISIAIPEPRSWSPSDPFLYGLRVQVDQGSRADLGLQATPSTPADLGPQATPNTRADPGGESPDPLTDEVGSYFGMRSIAVGRDEDGHRRLLLNGEPLFQYGLLDQGWWPDGLYAAPGDEALRFDVEQTKELGFNLIRKHVKVEPARWYYHCDRLGVLVWQDMPSGNNDGAAAEEEFGRELEAVVAHLRNHPSIVMWVPFNEGWGQHDTGKYVEWLKSEDPGRLVNNASGWTDTGVGDVLDIHRYPGPGAPSPNTLSETEGRAAVLGEFGGLGLPLGGHTWVDEDNWGYRSYETLPELNEAYSERLFQLLPLIGEGLAAAIYTQTTDVEVEVNGIMTYDREVVKLDDRAKGLHERLYRPPPTLRPVVPTSRDTGQRWRFTTTDPGEDWTESDFDDSGWIEGIGGFGTERTPGSSVRTVWDTAEIWVRRAFELTGESLEAAVEATRGDRLFLRIHHDEDAEVYLNGVRIAALEGYSSGYSLVPLVPETPPLFRVGENTLAVHVRQTDAGQYIDVGIVEWIEGGEG